MKKHREVVLFLINFFVAYFLLFVAYSFYLQKSQTKNDTFVCCGITKNVAHQTVSLLRFFGKEASTIQHEQELSMKIILNNIYTARVIEGCNSISVIILFLAFIFAFKGTLKNTLLFGFLGSLFLYVANIGRIALLTVLLQEYPDNQIFLHYLVFPAIIYGATFLLWFFWVQKFSLYSK